MYTEILLKVVLNTITLTLYYIQFSFSLGEEDDVSLLNFSDVKEVASPHINESYTEEETEQHVSPEARSLTDQG